VKEKRNRLARERYAAKKAKEAAEAKAHAAHNAKLKKQKKSRKAAALQLRAAQTVRPGSRSCC
jgi:hypothetical protein